MQLENATVHLKCLLLLWRICCCFVKDNGIYLKKCFSYISPGDTTDLGESLSLGLWKIVCWNFLFSATVIKSEVSLSDIRLCLFSGVPPGERLMGVLFRSERHPFLILLRSSSLRWLPGVAGSGLTGSKFFSWWLWEPLSFKTLFDVTRAAKFPTGGGGRGTVKGGVSWAAHAWEVNVNLALPTLVWIVFSEKGLSSSVPGSPIVGESKIVGKTWKSKALKKLVLIQLPHLSPSLEQAWDQ